jgi:hypothetical protein
VTSDVSLVFFGKVPARIDEDYVPAALQGFETMLLLIAIRRYPNALIAIGSALESALQSSQIGGSRRDGLQDLMKKAAKRSEALRGWTGDELESFRETRNDFVHRGFSPRDDERSVRAMIVTGIPLFHAILAEFLTFDLNEGLHAEYARHIQVATRVHSRAESVGQRAERYCLRALGASIRWSLKDNFQSYWELDALKAANEDGDRFIAHAEETKRISRAYDASCVCECPVCLEYNTAVVELDGDKLDAGEVQPVQLACVNCGFRATRGEHLLAEELLRGPLERERESVLKGYGIGG